MSFITSPGVRGFSNNLNTTAPNAAVPVAFFTAIGAPANVDAAIGPKGQGAVLAQVPDNLVPGGNKRGFNAVDLQTARLFNSNVASAIWSVISGGYSNTSSNQASVVSGGSQNTASGVASTVGGGTQNQATADQSVVAGGNTNVCDGLNSWIPGGQNATVRGVRQAWAYGTTQQAFLGDRQLFGVWLRANTSNAVARIMDATDSGSNTVTSSALLANNSVAHFKARVSVRNLTTGTDGAAFEITGAIKRNANAGTTALVGVPVVTTVGVDASLAGIAIAATADTTVGCLSLTATGLAATNIAWLAHVEMIQVQG